MLVFGYVWVLDKHSTIRLGRLNVGILPPKIPQTYIIPYCFNITLVQTQTRAVELACGNLFKVFGNYDAASHREAIESFYHEDGIVYEPYGEIIQGHDAIDKRVQEILEQNVDWEFKTVGPVKQKQDLVVIAWTFGPKGEVALEGTDVIIVENGKIKVLYGLLGDQADVKL
ncbi:hypothetical protein BOTNAR_0102g00230 [Botryotinia narcissicola]|uniref:SnoaL-like domain-containing protein n=1 Tax=Botryotinia narcissicola TaxID=278944 RepID=A0A4Z1IP19_9HELO|nr:hypothetical protein BOTNAR_0102g00230 [Botryotinia narcissicola]